jgi:hypothetical protein
VDCGVIEAVFELLFQSVSEDRQRGVVYSEESGSGEKKRVEAHVCRWGDLDAISPCSQVREKIKYVACTNDDFRTGGCPLFAFRACAGILIKGRGSLMCELQPATGQGLRFV